MSRDDLAEAIDSFIDPLDPDLLALQELAAVQACSDRRFLPDRFRELPREEISGRLAEAKQRLAYRR